MENVTPLCRLSCVCPLGIMCDWVVHYGGNHLYDGGTGLSRVMPRFTS